MALMQAGETISSALNSISKTAGQVIYVRDTKRLYFDSLNGDRIEITDIIPLATESEREALLSPIENKLYYVIQTFRLWIYSGGNWHIPASGGAAPYVNTYTASAWQGSAAPFTIIIPEETHGKGNNPTVTSYDGGGNKIDFGVNVNSSTGEVRLYSNVAVAFKINIT